MDPETVSDLENFHFKFKISIVGDTGVGKSSFVEGNYFSFQLFHKTLEKLSKMSNQLKFIQKQLFTLMRLIPTKSSISTCKESNDITHMYINMQMDQQSSFLSLTVSHLIPSFKEINF